LPGLLLVLALDELPEPVIGVLAVFLRWLAIKSGQYIYHRYMARKHPTPAPALDQDLSLSSP